MLLELLQVDGKERILPVVRQSETFAQQMQELAAQNEQLTAENQQLQEGITNLQGAEPDLCQVDAQGDVPERGPDGPAAA